MTKKSRLSSMSKFFTLFMVCAFLFFSASIFADEPVKTKKETATKEPNGCGPRGFGLLVPDKILNNDAKNACDKHDKCYSDLSKTKSECDNQFAKDLKDNCSDKKGISRSTCELGGELYSNAVKNPIGQYIYDTRQKEAKDKEAAAQDKAKADADRAAQDKAKADADRAAQDKAKADADRAAQDKAKADADKAAQDKAKADADKAAQDKAKADADKAAEEAKKKTEQNQ